jgi:hypothetical protein
MRKLLCVSAGVLGTFVNHVSAQSISANVDIIGHVAEKCLFTTDGDMVTIPELAIVAGAINDVGRLDETTVNTQSATLSGWCNGKAAEGIVTLIGAGHRVLHP